MVVLWYMVPFSPILTFGTRHVICQKKYRTALQVEDDETDAQKAVLEKAATEKVTKVTTDTDVAVEDATKGAAAAEDDTKAAADKPTGLLLLLLILLLPLLLLLMLLLLLLMLKLMLLKLLVLRASHSLLPTKLPSKLQKNDNDKKQKKQ